MVNNELYGSIKEDCKEWLEDRTDTVALVTFSKSLESRSKILDVKPPPNPPPTEW